MTMRTRSPWTSMKKTSMTKTANLTTPTSTRTRTPVPSTKKTWTTTSRQTTTVPSDREGVRLGRLLVRGPQDDGRAVQGQMMGRAPRVHVERHARQRRLPRYGEDGETDGESKQWVDASIESK